MEMGLCVRLEACEVNVRDLIASHEGESAKPYMDTVGKLSIGIGRNLTDKGLSPAEVDYLFQNDLGEAHDAAKSFPWFHSLDEVRQAALIDLIFNLGLTKFRKFVQFISAMAARDWVWAAEELKDSVWWTQVGRRGPRIRSMILTGQWPK